MSSKLKIAAALGGMSAILASGTSSLAAGRFDGGWNVEIICADFGDVQGYTWRFPLQVRVGRISGKYINPNDPGNFGQLTGTISSSGDARVIMHGQTGVPAFNVHHEAIHTKLFYTASVHFDENGGSGKRNEQRSCDLSFSKR